jgi:hypothetical protein
MRILQFFENILRRFHKKPDATPYEMWLGYNAGFNLMPNYKKTHNPYFWGTAKWEWWEDGWIDGMSELTREKQDYIEHNLLELRPSLPLTDPWFSGAVKEYWEKRMNQLRKAGCFGKEEIRK